MIFCIAFVEEDVLKILESFKDLDYKIIKRSTIKVAYIDCDLDYVEEILNKIREIKSLNIGSEVHKKLGCIDFWVEDFKEITRATNNNRLLKSYTEHLNNNLDIDFQYNKMLNPKIGWKKR